MVSKIGTSKFHNYHQIDQGASAWKWIEDQWQFSQAREGGQGIKLTEVNDEYEDYGEVVDDEYADNAGRDDDAE